MRHILTSVVLIVLLFPALALGEAVTMDDLVERDGLYYQENADVPFTGEVTGKGQGAIKNGKIEGPWVHYHDNYHDNGRLKEEGSYKDGKKEGPWFRYYDNGQLEGKGTYKDGEEDGPWVYYHDNGQLSYKGTFKNRKQVGPWVSYNRDGTVNEKYTGTFKNGVKVD